MDFHLKVQGLNLERTLFCGQAFRWKKVSDCEFFGMADSKSVLVRENSDGISFLNISENDFIFWKEYFDLDTDYVKIVEQFSSDAILKKACEFSHGIRILKQEPFETLISFIISQNNNIPRITGIIERLCESFGERLNTGYAFPTAEALAKLTQEELSPIRAGFRARYIIDAAQKVKNGTVDLNALYNMTAEDAKTELLKIKGVGDKVADCILLFSYRKTTQVPHDVWIKRVMTEFYPNGLPECVGEYSGIAQQFLFDYIRHNWKKE